MEKIIQKLREKKNQDSNLEQVLIDLHKQGFTIVESMKILVQAYSISLTEAKEIVSSQPVWNDVVTASVSLHNDLINTE